MENLLEIKDLFISFKTNSGEVQAIRGVSYEVKKGEVLGVVGESGCGKSVTSQAVMQILPKPPAIYKSGEIIFEGQNLLKYSERQMQEVRGKSIGMIFQDPMTSLNPTMKIGAQIAEGLIKHQKMSKSDALKRAVEMLTDVGVANPEKRVNQYPHQFSGGMRQRVMIALALVCRPKLLIADEPTTALDVTIQAQILMLMRDLQRKYGTSIVLITHDLGVVAEMCHRIVVMYAGEVIEKGSASAIFYNPKHPYTRGLLNSVPHMKMDRTKVLTPIFGTPPDLFAPPTGCPFYARCSSAMKICKEHRPDFIKMPANNHDKNEEHFAACWLNHEIAGGAN